MSDHAVPGPHPAPVRVLVVDDEDEVRALLVDLLTDEGYRVSCAADAADALEQVRAERPDVVLLDVSMPSMNGLDLLGQLRRGADIPTLLVTGRGSETDRVLGLRLGADDYVVKPFSSAELVARIQAVLRRSQRVPAVVEPGRRDFGRLVIDPTSREVSVDGTEVSMTAKEFDLLAFLSASPRQVFSREQLLSQVWGSSSEWQDPATVTEHIRRLRQKIEDDPYQPTWLTTVRGVGYRFRP